MKVKRILFILGLALVFCTPGRQETVIQNAEPLVSVRLAAVERREFAMSVHSAGMIALKETIKLSFKIGGIIKKINVDEGQAVEAGRVLASLDQSEIQAQYNKAQSAYDKADRDLERVKSLFKDNVAPLEQLQNAQTAWEIARSDLRVAEFNLKHSVITAPSAGMILKRFAEEEELIGAGTPVLVFASTARTNWILRFGAIDRDVNRLSLGDPADVYIDVYPQLVFKGSVSEIGETADPYTGTFEVELAIDEKPGIKLVSGFVAKIDVYPTLTEHLDFIPLQAFVEGQKKNGFVFSVDKSFKAVRHPVVIGWILDDSVAVLKGLEGIDQIVSSGAAYLSDGDRVRIAEK